MCCDFPQISHTGYSSICIKCGCERIMLANDVYNIHSAPMVGSYNRTLRFRIKCLKLLLIKTGPKIHDNVWHVLEANREFISNPEDIRRVLRTAKLKNKHYDHMHLFSKIFCSNYRLASTDAQEILNIFMKEFDTLYFRWKKIYYEGLFFSSDWLIRKMCNEFTPFLLPFLKPKTSAQRHLKYEKMYLTLFPIDDETLNHVTSTSHFRNMKVRLKNHQIE